MKSIFTTTLCFLLVACDSPPPAADSPSVGAAKLEAEAAALAADQQRVAAEQALAKRLAAAEQEGKRLTEERARLEAEKERLAQDQAKLETERSAHAEAASAPPAKEPASAGETTTLTELLAARAMDEKGRLEALEAEAEADRLAAQRAAAETKAREAAAKRAAEEAAIERTTAVFFEALAGHGDWFATDRHGFAWRPKRAAIDPEWRPYTDGRWQWTEYGWTWQSLEPYGWAVYHYGRWFRHPKSGWLWVPGHEWAPAWVAWRMKGSEYAGWAPLPPTGQKSARGYGAAVDRELEIPPGRYVFLEARNFDEPTYTQKFVDRSRQMEMLRGSRNVTRLEQRATAGGATMVAGGPDPGVISSVIRQHREDPEARPLPQLNLVFGGKPAAEHAGDIVEAGAMLLFAPKLESSRHNRKPAAVQETLRVPEREDGWSRISPAHEAEWRSMVEREALHAAAVARAVQQKPRPSPRSAMPVAQRTVTAPQPAKVSPAPPARPNPLNPSSLQPASGLFNRR